jgi:hypothetical protein
MCGGTYLIEPVAFGSHFLKLFFRACEPRSVVSGPPVIEAFGGTSGRKSRQGRQRYVGAGAIA